MRLEVLALGLSMIGLLMVRTLSDWWLFVRNVFLLMIIGGKLHLVAPRQAGDCRF